MTQEQAAYQLGWDAAWKLLPISANPFDPRDEDVQWLAWRNGWNHAMQSA